MKKTFLFIIAMVVLLTYSSCHKEEPKPDWMVNPWLGPMYEDSRSDILQTLEVNKGDLNNVVSRLSLFNVKSRGASYIISTINDQKGQPCIYVLNFDGGGWTLISATKKFSPVLAYNDEGYFNINDSMPPGLELWKQNLVSLISDVDNQLSEDSIQFFQKEWNSISPLSISPLSTNVDDYRDEPHFSSDFTQEDYDRLRAIMADTIAQLRGKGYTVETFEHLRSGDLIPGEYGDQGITINDLTRMCDGMTYIFYSENFRFISFAAYKTDYIEEKTGPYIQSTWNQSGGKYNSAFPMLDGQHCPAGCVPVAVGQLMRAYEHPTNYKDFKWSDMPLNEPNEIISQFLYDIALEMGTTFDKLSGSPTPLKNMKKFLNKYYSFKEKSSTDALDGQVATIYASFEEGQHEWLSGGYWKTHRFTANEIYTFTFENEMTTCGNMQQITEYPATKLIYMNWGWGGRYDGYYGATSLRYPGGSSVGTDFIIYTNFIKK